MTDHPSQYNMIPSFNASLIQQQQQLNQAQQAQQQAQQAQIDSPQTRQTFIKPEQRQMWQMHQLGQQQQFRAQNPGNGAESQQLADFLRNQHQQATSRPAGSQTQQVPIAAVATLSPQPSQSNFIPNATTSSSIPFGALSNLNTTTNHLGSLASSSQGSMRQQLERLQQHGGQSNKFPHASQQPNMQNPASGPFSLGTGESSSSSSSSKPQQHGASVGNPQQQILGVGRRPMTLTELSDRARVVRDQVSNLEGMVLQLSRNQSGASDLGYVQKMQFLVKEIQTRKDYLNKVAQAATQQFGVGLLDSPSNSNSSTNMPPNGGNNTQPLAAAWMSQVSNSKTANFATAASLSHNPLVSRGGLPVNSGQLGGNGSPLAQQQQLPAQRLAPNANQPTLNGVVNGAAASQSTSAPNSQAIDPVAQYGALGPLEKAKFESAYQNFCKTKNLNLDSRLMTIDNRTIDLHALHVQVISEGGLNKISQNDAWPIIGARLGFVQFPGTDANPAKSGPAIAQQLAHIYRQYLHQFDSIYMHSVLDSRRKMMQQQQSHSQPSAAGAPRAINAQQMQALLSYAKLSAEQLRAQGVPENTIRFVESRRPYLQRSTAEQGVFRGQLRAPASASQSSGGGAHVLGPSHSNGGAAPPPLGMRPLHPPQNPTNPGPGISAEHRATTGIDSNQLKAEHLQLGVQFASKVEQDFAPQLQQMLPQEVPNESRIDFNTTLEQSHRLAGEMRNKAPMFFVVARNEEAIRRLIHIIATVSHQRVLLSSNPPKYILSMEMLRGMLLSMQKYNEQFHQIVTQLSHKQQAQQQQTLSSASDSQPTLRTSVQTTPQPIPQPPQNPTPSRPLPVPASMKKTGSSPTALSAPTPPTSTPTTNTASASHVTSSPQPPKSPKTKTTPKNGSKKPRRPSKAQLPVSQSNSASTPTSQNADEPITAPSPSSNLKRPREEAQAEPPTLGSKRAKTANENSASTDSELPVSPDKVDTSTINTEDEASAFFEQMSELIRIAADSEGQETLSTDISDTLEMILKGCSGSEQDYTQATSLPSLDFADVVNPTHVNRNNEFPEFLDLSSYGGQDDDDGGFKVATPDLVASSSTNPSPESAASDLDITHKAEDISDSLRLGVWKEIDGGESAYYTQQGEWKWDSPMPTSEQSWAMFTS
jgi:hypothetical protein